MQIAHMFEVDDVHSSWLGNQERELLKTRKERV